MNTAELAELAELKQGARQVWAAGDFPAVALRQLWEVGPLIVERVDVRPGEDVLDVACGTGNAAIPAARAGGVVVGVDLTPELFDAGRTLAAEAGVRIDWIQGDAEALPFDAESFDVVLSTFGVMFAPRHATTAQELARVLRPGGRMGLCNWTPEGLLGSFFRTVGGYLPSHSPLADPPLLWGSEAHVQELLEGTGIELEFERQVVAPAPFDSPEAELEFMTAKFGPVIMARRLTEASGQWDELRGELIALLERDEPAEYLVTVGRKAA